MRCSREVEDDDKVGHPIVSDEDIKDEPIVGELRRHHLPHLPVLRVGASVRDARFMRACDAGRCSSVCCGTGVYADSRERESILEHANSVIAIMDPEQPKDPSAWFDDERLEDADFPSGVGVGTQTGERGCVFLNGEGRCVLQIAHQTGLVPMVLKPFYCWAFPVTIYGGILALDIDNVPGTRTCCQPVDDSTVENSRTALDVFEWEFLHVLGPDGVAELREVLASST